MSDINIDFTVANIDATFTVEPNEISFTPSDIQLTVYTGGYVDNATGLNANISNVHIFGGTNGYVLQTDGTGNLSWTAQSGGGGNGSPGGSNTQVQFNDSGTFAGNVGFTFNNVTGNLQVPNNVGANKANIGNVIITANGITTPGYYGDITGGNLFSALSIEASLQLTTANVIANLVTANYVATSNIVGNVSVSGNITSTGNVSVGNLVASTGLGYTSGGTVTQLTSRTTGVTLNATSGLITLYTTTLAGNTAQQFTLTNSFIKSTDMIVIQHVSGGTMGLYNVTATPSNGSAVITIRNNSASVSSSQAPVIQFMILRAG